MRTRPPALLPAAPGALKSRSPSQRPAGSGARGLRGGGARFSPGVLRPQGAGTPQREATGAAGGAGPPAGPPPTSFPTHMRQTGHVQSRTRSVRLTTCVPEICPDTPGTATFGGCVPSSGARSRETERSAALGSNPALASPWGLIVVCQNIPSVTSTRGCPRQGGRVVVVGRGSVALCGTLGKAWPPVVTTEGGDVQVLPWLSRGPWPSSPWPQVLWSAHGWLQQPLDLSHCLWTL